MGVDKAPILKAAVGGGGEARTVGLAVLAPAAAEEDAVVAVAATDGAEGGVGTRRAGSCVRRQALASRSAVVLRVRLTSRWRRATVRRWPLAFGSVQPFLFSDSGGSCFSPNFQAETILFGLLG